MATSKKSGLSDEQQAASDQVQGAADSSQREPEGGKPASDLPDPNPHVAGQTPAGETDQLDYSPATDFASALGEAQLALTNIHFDMSQPSAAPEHIDPVIEALENALEAAKKAKKDHKS